jgi:hypothetical protein
MAKKASQRGPRHIPKSGGPVGISASPDALPVDAITAEGLEDQVKHAACRAGFYTEMLGDPRVGKLFDRWWLETGLAAVLVRLRDLPEPEQSKRKWEGSSSFRAHVAGGA